MGGSVCSLRNGVLVYEIDSVVVEVIGVDGSVVVLK